MGGEIQLGSNTTGKKKLEPTLTVIDASARRNREKVRVKINLITVLVLCVFDCEESLKLQG